MENSIEGKICSKCRTFKKYSEFYPRAAMNDGRTSQCKECGRKLSTYWKQRNQDHMTEYILSRYLSKTLEERNAWKKSNPLKYLRHTARANSKRYNREFTITLEHLRYLWDIQKGLCYYTGRPMKYTVSDDEAVSIDRVDSGLGYTPDNVVLCQYRINVMKNNIPVDKLIQIAKDIIQIHG